MASPSVLPRDKLLEIAEQHDVSVTDVRLAKLLDHQDSLSHFRDEFCYPTVGKLLDNKLEEGVDGDQPCVYFCSNSLGLMPKNLKPKMEEEVDKWANRALYGHFEGKYPWAYFEHFTNEKMAKIVGAKKEEVIVMNGLTVNLHQSLVAFYRPTSTRYKILCEKDAFPSDHYAFQSHIKLHGYDPTDALLCMEPCDGELTWRMEDILKVIEEEGESIALIMFSGVHYFTGQCFDMKSITAAGHRKGCFVGFDLAHAVGNVELFLHDWDVDVACWCTYKYLCSGCGGAAGFYIHEKYANDFDVPRLLGWWAHKMDTRFDMNNELELRSGACGFQMSNPSPFAGIGVVASLEVFSKTSMAEIRKKSLLLTGYLELLIDKVFGTENGDANDEEPSAKRSVKNVRVEIITPRDPAQRGCQLSLRFSHPLKEVHAAIKKLGVVVDTREPNIMRVAPYPLVNTFADVHRFVDLLETATNKL